MNSDDSKAVVTLLADVISSREIADQGGLFNALEAAMGEVNRDTESLQPLRLMTGDEVQGVYASLESALRASLYLQLHLHERYGIRVGLGRGPIHVDSARAPAGQSGPGWWFAREAIDEAAGLHDSHGWPKAIRSRFKSADPEETGWVNAYMVYRDQILAGMDAKDARITLGLFSGETQDQLTGALGIKSQSTVSKRQSNNGPAALYRSQESLPRELP